MTDETLPRRERDKLRQRQEMLGAALHLFSEKGYHNVSMHEIAERAEFAVGTLYKFFQNKEDLYRAIVLEQGEKFSAAFMRAIEEPDDEVEKLRNYVRTRGEVFRGNLPLIRLFLAESRGASFCIKAGLAGLDEEMRRGYYDVVERLAAVFESGIKRKRFKKIANPYYLAVALEGLINSLHLLWIDAPDRHPYPEDPDTILSIFFRGLIDA
jgi:AcrR family transcriptional regulator